jgi:serine protease Do
MPNAGPTRRAERSRAAALATRLPALAFGTAVLTALPRTGQAQTANVAPERPGVTAVVPRPAQAASLSDRPVPPDLTERAPAEPRSGGPAERGWLGVALQPLDEELAGVLGAPDGKGALVASVEPDSPAARGGLKQGDIVIGVAGKAVQRQRDLAAAVADAKPGSTVAVTVLRSGQRMDHQVAVGEPPGPTGPAAATPQDAASAVDAAREAGRPAAVTRIESGGRASQASPSEAG